MSKRVVTVITEDSRKTEEESMGVRLVCETLTDGSKVYNIEFTKPVSIICTSWNEALEVFDYLDKMWWERI